MFEPKRVSEDWWAADDIGRKFAALAGHEIYDAEFKESDHPRGKAGSEKGGQFVKKGEGGRGNSFSISEGIAQGLFGRAGFSMAVRKTLARKLVNELRINDKDEKFFTKEQLTGALKNVGFGKTVVNKFLNALEPKPEPKPEPVNYNIKRIVDLGNPAPAPDPPFVDEDNDILFQALDSWTMAGDYYEYMNNTLRGLPLPGNRFTEDDVKKENEAIINWLDKASYPYDTVAYRRIAIKDILNEVKVGSILEDKGFMASSLSKDFSKPSKDFPDIVVLKINIPKGAKAAYLDGYSESNHEEEVLIQRDSKLKVTKIDKNYRIIECDLIQDHLK